MGVKLEDDGLVADARGEKEIPSSQREARVDQLDFAIESPRIPLSHDPGGELLRRRKGMEIGQDAIIAKDVVAIEVDNVLAACQVHPLVKGIGNAFVRLGDIANMRKLAYDIECAIFGRAIHNPMFD